MPFARPHRGEYAARHRRGNRRKPFGDQRNCRRMTFEANSTRKQNNSKPHNQIKLRRDSVVFTEPRFAAPLNQVHRNRDRKKSDQRKFGDFVAVPENHQLVRAVEEIKRTGRRLHDVAMPEIPVRRKNGRHASKKQPDLIAARFAISAIAT